MTIYGKLLTGIFATNGCELEVPKHASRIHSHDPLIAEYDNWLPAGEIKKILKLRKQFDWYQGGSVDRVSLTKTYDPDIREAENYKVKENDPFCLSGLAAKVAEFLKLPNEKYIEPTLLIRYQVGGHFANHTDWWEVTNSHGVVTNRQATFIVYLNSDFEGGQTHFQNAGITIDPAPGKALLFTYGKGYMHNHHPKAHHSSLPITAGTKHILIFFIRDNEFTEDLRKTVRY